MLIEPGLIRTGFGDAAGSAIGDAEGDEVYRPFHAEVARLTREASELGMTAKLSGTSDDVAFVIEKAITVRRPRSRVHGVALGRAFYRATPFSWRLGLGRLSRRVLSVPRSRAYRQPEGLIPPFTG